jgi:hypothetical protein
MYAFRSNGSCHATKHARRELRAALKRMLLSSFAIPFFASAIPG